MPGVVLQTKALTVVNKGGGYPTRTVREEIAPGVRAVRRRLVSRDRVKGTDYVIFNCAGCGARNKRSMYEVIGSAGQSISFKCNRCRRENEVARPAASLIVAPEGKSPGALVDPSGREIGR